MDYDLLHQLIPNAHQLLNKKLSKYTGIISVTGDRKEMEGVISLPINLGNVIGPHLFYIIRDLQPEVIMGRDFLYAHECVLDFSSHTLRSRPIAKLTLQNTIRIPPKSIVVCQAKTICPTYYVTGMLMEVYKTRIIPDVHTQPSISKLMRHSTTIQIFNNSNAEQIIHKNTTVARAHPLTDDKNLNHVNVVSCPPVIPCLTQTYNSDKAHRKLFPLLYTEATSNTLQDTDIKPSQNQIPLNDNNCLSPEGKSQFQEILHRRRRAFVGPEGKLGRCDLYQVKIQLKEGAQPFRKRPYRLAPHIQNEAQKQIDKFLNEGILQECDSSYNSPLLVITKGQKRSHKHMQSDKSTLQYRIVVDLRELNSQIVNTTRLVPNPEELLDRVCQNYSDSTQSPKFFTSLDMKDSFYQIVLHKDSRHLTAFEFNNRSYAFCRIPMGMNLSAGVLVKVVNQILAPLTDINVIAYLDDILIMSPDEVTHSSDVEKVLNAFEQANLLLNPKKCEFAVSKAEFLGFTLTADGISPSDKHLEALRSYISPVNIKEIRVFLGLINFFKKHIPNKAILCKPLNDLTRKNAIFDWSTTCQANFEKLIQILTTTPALAYPRFNEQFYLATDASNMAVGGVLTQYSEKLKAHKPIGYCGRALNKHERNYSITKLELLAVIYCVLHFRVYLQNPIKPFILYTDHSALTSILHKKPVSAQIARYSLILQSFDFKVVHVSGLMNSAADCLSRKNYLLSSDNITKLISKYPDNQIMGQPDTATNAHLRVPQDSISEDDDVIEFPIPIPTVIIPNHDCNAPIAVVNITVSSSPSESSDIDSDNFQTSTDLNTTTSSDDNINTEIKSYPSQNRNTSNTPTHHYSDNSNITIFQGADHIFSNFYHIPEGIVIQDIRYFTVAHAYQAEKLKTLDQNHLLSFILQISNPSNLKQKINYELNQIENLNYALWNQIKTIVLSTLIKCKIKALPCIHDILVNTVGIIAEGSTNLFWGSGHNALETAKIHPRNWKGKNQLGIIFMKIRKCLQILDHKFHKMTKETLDKITQQNDRLNSNTYTIKSLHQNNILENNNLSTELRNLFLTSNSCTSMPRVQFHPDLIAGDLQPSKIPQTFTNSLPQKSIVKPISKYKIPIPEPIITRSRTSKFTKLIPPQASVLNPPTTATPINHHKPRQVTLHEPTIQQSRVKTSLTKTAPSISGQLPNAHLIDALIPPPQEFANKLQSEDANTIIESEINDIIPLQINNQVTLLDNTINNSDNKLQDLILPDVRNLKEDENPNSTLIHRYNLRPLRKPLPTTRAQKREKLHLIQQIKTEPDLITGRTDIPKHEIVSAQRADMYCNKLIQYLLHQYLPTDPISANHILNLANTHLYIDNILYQIHYFSKKTGFASRLKLVVPKSLVRRIILLNHVNPRSAHRGVIQTLIQLKERYYWNDMVTDVRNVIGSCEQCLEYKRSQRTEDPLMILQEPTYGPWERVVIDTLGPLPQSNNRNLYCLIVVDCYSRYLIAVPMRNKKAETIAHKFYDHVIAIFGSIKYLHSDRGTEICSGVMTQLTKLYGIIQTKSSGYHSHSSGLAESGVKRLVSALRTISAKNPKNWDQYLPSLLFAINCSPTKFSGHSPYLLLFGRLPFLPVDFITKPEEDNINLRSEFLRDIIQTHTLISADAVHNQQVTNQRMKAYYDKNRKNSTINVGDFVYIRTPVDKNDEGRKLASYYTGPFLITNLLPFNRVEMKNIQTDTQYHHPLHTSRLKLASHYKPELAYRAINKTP